MREIVLTADEINETCKRLGAELTEKYKNSDSLPVFVCILKGAVLFFTDLIKNCDFPMAIDFIQVTSYDGTSSTGVIHLKKDLTENVTGRDVVIVEDVVDTGLTLNYLKQYIQIKHNPKSISVVCLVDKTPLRKVDFHVDYVGLHLKENKFLCGYGFDYHEIVRNVPYLYVPDKQEIEEMDEVLAKDKSLREAE